MQFTGKDIEKQCNRMRLLKGKALYASNKVEDFQVLNKCSEVRKWMQEYGDEALLTHLPEEDQPCHVYVLLGKVRGSEGQRYDTRVVIDDASEDKVLDASCTCADFTGGTPFCKHCVAVAHNFVMHSLEEQLADKLVKPEELMGRTSREEMKENVPVVDATGRLLERNGYASVNDRQGRNSSGAIMQLIKNFSGMTNLEQWEDNGSEQPIIAQGLIELVPNLVDDGYGHWRIDFRIGTTKKYVVKDVWELAQLLREKQYHAYGKSLAFIHDRKYFTQESQYYIDMILDMLSIQSQSRFGTETMRYLKVTDGYMEQLIARKKGQKLLVNGSEYLVLEENPQLPMKIEKAEYGCTITVDNVAMILGVSRAFMILSRNSGIYMVSREYRDTVVPFLQTFKEYRDWNYTQSFSKKAQYTCYLNHRDYVSFCGHVLRKVSRYFAIQETDMDLEDFMPEPCQIKIYLDSPSDTVLTCNLKAVYGQREYPVSDWAARTEGEFRDLEQEQKVYLAAKRYFSSEQRVGQEYLLCCESEDEIYELLQHGIKELEEYGQMYVSENIRAMTIRKSPKISAGVQVQGSLLRMDISIPDMSSEEISQILSAYRLKKRYYRMKNGDFMQLEGNGLQTISDLSRGLDLTEKDWENGSIQMPLYRANFIDAMMKERGKNVTIVRSSEFKSIIRDMKEVEDSDYEVPKEIKADLRGYQKTGYRWLRTLAHYGFGGILADDMGLGKTLQVLTLLQAVMLEPEYDAKTSTSLIVCPASLVYNWESECRKFAPQIRCRVVVGSASERKKKMQSLKNVDLVITSYDLLKRDYELYQDKEFLFMIIDEAQYIKNATTQVSQAVKAVISRYRYALTGTPVENRLSDLWSIFDFVMKGYLYSYERFRKNFEQPIVGEQDERALNRLQKLVSPFILRRRKKEVLKDLPDKIENIVYTNMTEEQARYYHARFLKLRRDLVKKSDEEFKADKLRVLAELTRLRQLCCDPSLFMEGYTGGSGKVDAFLSMVEELVDAGSNILVFSQFSTMLTVLQNALRERGIHTLLLTGQNSKEERRNMVEEFQQGTATVFLISLKAGGTGLNLTAADTVIHFDPWWNIAAQNQATDRAHRIGQDKVVTVIQLVMKNSIEERIIELQNRKKELVENVIEADAVSSTALTKEEIMGLLEEF